MSHYRSNVRDLEFNLFEVLGLGGALEAGHFGDLDEQTARDMLAAAARTAEGPLAESYVPSDRQPPTFFPDEHRVELSPLFKRSVRAWEEGGWPRIGLPPELGGISAPRILTWAINELGLGANPAAYMYLTGDFLASVLYGLGTDEQRDWAKRAVENRWGATMVLTEPEAGSDVGAARTRAVQQEDGSWHLSGVKRFITSADSDDLFDNILHFVLARPEGARQGTKGLSMFVVPKWHFDAGTGNLGERNGVFVTGVESKMGLKSSATCEVTFGGGRTPAVGWLVGDVHNGIAQMFKIIEDARMMVGTKAIAALSTGYLSALDYAKQRVQGADLTRITDKSAPRVSITHHPDVRRSLMLQKGYAEGMRALYLFTAAHQDDETAWLASSADPRMASSVSDLMLPIIKGAGSERAYQMLTEALQVFGGSGYLQDYPIEQYVRDAKIDSLYEGTTAIQAQDFFFRKIARDNGVTFSHLLSQIQATVDGHADDGRFGPERLLLGAALHDVQFMQDRLIEVLLSAMERPSELYKIGMGSVMFLLAVGDLLIAWRLLVGAETAHAVLDSGMVDGNDASFYQGKIAVAAFFAKQVLPRLRADSAVIAGMDLDLMHADEAVF